jgi:serine phosphatase RsbU (regulator of sigma subunit)
MELFHKIAESWGAVRWKMLVIFAFFSIISTVLVAAASVAFLNVVVRRENTNLIQERISAIADSYNRFAPFLLERVAGCQTLKSNSPILEEYSTALFPETQSSVTALPKGARAATKPRWLDTGSFSGVVVDQGNLEIRALRSVEREGCLISVLVRVPLTESFLNRLSTQVGLKISGTRAVPIARYRAERGMAGEVEANFIPGSGYPVPVLVSARNWATGQFEDWTVCQLRPTYAPTVEGLNRMGLRKASWISPFGSIAFGLALIYAAGLLLSVRLSQRIIAAIDGLSNAARRVGKGDFSVRLPVREQDQLGILASSFNEMTKDLETLREQEKRSAVLERDIALAQEVQQYLYPRTPPVLSGASVWAGTTAARVVSGDLYDFLSFRDGKVGLLCADVSGKGVSAALMMSHLQALARGRLLSVDESRVQPRPATFVTGFNRDLRGRFGNNRYATMFYAEFDWHSKLLRYINAGHCPPILISETGEPMRLTEGDLPVGLLPQAKYEELRLDLSKGGAVIVYTDGVTDALNSKGEEFGEARLMRCCNSLPVGAGAEAVGSLISRTVIEWTAGVEQFDDATILVLSVEGAERRVAGGNISDRDLTG